MSDVGVVIIGRNEGERFQRCLRSIQQAGAPASLIAYVDSGSTDDSVAFARSLGVEVVELDMSVPFTAARARNAGFERLFTAHPGMRYVQFVDGDSELRADWLRRGTRELDEHPEAAAVAGRVRERFPDASVYNRLADFEWDTPAGETTAVGGISMMRVAAFREVGGFDPTLSAAEEPELCSRYVAAGWKIYRLADAMALHDLAMFTFGQWWKRSTRNGYGWMGARARFGPGPNGDFDRRVAGPRGWAVGWTAAVIAVLLIALACLVVGLTVWRPAVSVGIAGLIGGLALFALLPLNMARLAVKGRRRLPDWRTAITYGVLTMLDKWGNVAGHRRWRRDRAQGEDARLIEYKAGPVSGNRAVGNATAKARRARRQTRRKRLGQ